jgi:hypothetical protein
MLDPSREYLTESGKRCRIIKVLKGRSDIDGFDRVRVQYIGGGRRQQCTLQPKHLRPLPPLSLTVPNQYCLDFA